MRDSAEGCILLERMAKVEAKQWVLICLVGILIGVLSLITFKLLDSQILLLSGEQGLHAVSTEARSDIQIIRKAVK
jgi:hypothetical protein